MTVKSVNTRNLTKAELDKEDARIKEMTAAELRNFRESGPDGLCRQEGGCLIWKSTVF